ncbi:ABC transporter ATP-binding protein [Planobispora siamensis]|uniref:ABC transporter ATP-binding protein n=1 Tax=Planobispora siamensis TaxID=936338 RepID=UPI0019509D61|nr:ABC transporter ATP-binding protein [Planobispora siamensis]
MTTSPSTAPRAAAAEPVQLWSVRKVYGSAAGEVTALDDMTVSFQAGTFTAVMGPSGSGKSTLLHCAAGLDRPTDGKVIIDGTDLGPLDETALTLLRRKRIGFVFQSFNLVSALTAEQNVALPLRLAGIRPRGTEVRAALAEVGLAGRAGHRPGELSGGEQQRVAIARALITGPAVLFADEPTGALDSRTSRDVLRLLRSLTDHRRQTVIMVTHDPVAAAHADRVLLLADGRVVDEFATADLPVRDAGPGGREGDGGSGPVRRELGAEAIAARMAVLEASC